MKKQKHIVDPKYKGLVMAALKEAYSHNLLGSIGDREAANLCSRLEMEDYCNERGIKFEKLTPEDFETYALAKIDKEEAQREVERQYYD